MSWNEHTKWFNNIIKNPSVHFYIICIDKTSAGQLRFELFEKKFLKTTIYLDKLFIGKGLGPQALNLGCSLISEKYRRGTFIAYIKDNNKTSIKAFQKSGFSYCESHIMDNHITMSREF